MTNSELDLAKDFARQAEGWIPVTTASLHHKIGDLIFCRGQDGISRALIFAQRYIDGEPARFSHVAMCIYPGLFLHSVPGGGVQLIRAEERGNEEIDFLSGDVIALRPDYGPIPDFTLLKAMLFWTGQRYNFSFFKPMSSFSGKAYCSQLIVQVMQRLQLRHLYIDGKELITPSRLFRVAAENATDVTDKYRFFAEHLRQHRHERRRLEFDFAREQVFKSVRHTVTQSRTRKALTFAVNQLAESAAQDSSRLHTQLQRMSGVRPLTEMAKEAGGHLHGSALLFELLSLPDAVRHEHYEDIGNLPAAVVSGIHLHSECFRQIAAELDQINTTIIILCDGLAFAVHRDEFADQQELLMAAGVELLARLGSSKCIARDIHAVIPGDLDTRFRGNDWLVNKLLDSIQMLQDKSAAFLNYEIALKLHLASRTRSTTDP